MRTVLSALGAAAGAVIAFFAAFLFARPVIEAYQGPGRDQEAVMDISGYFSLLVALLAAGLCWGFVRRLTDPERPRPQPATPDAMEEYALEMEEDDPYADTMNGGLSKEGLVAIAVIFGVVVWQLYDMYG